MAIFIPLLFIVVMAVANFRMIAADPASATILRELRAFLYRTWFRSLVHSPIECRMVANDGERLQRTRG